jgi:TRAP-type C4-dicarboxylate transport system permease small subunit
MGLVKSIKTVLDRLLEGLVMTVVTVLVLDVLWQVFTRFVLNRPSTWTEEPVSYTHLTLPTTPYV